MTLEEALDIVEKIHRQPETGKKLRMSLEEAITTCKAQLARMIDALQWGENFTPEMKALSRLIAVAETTLKERSKGHNHAEKSL